MGGFVREEAPMVDQLTGLFTRRELYERVGTTVTAPPSPVVLYIDIDDLRRVNLAHGVDAGNRAICEVARRVVDQAGPEAVVARIGGNEFGVVLAESNATIGSQTAEAIADAVHGSPVLSKGATAFNVSVTIGLAGPLEASCELDELLGRAHRAYIDAKRGGQPLGIAAHT